MFFITFPLITGFPKIILCFDSTIYSVTKVNSNTVWYKICLKSLRTTQLISEVFVSKWPSCLKMSSYNSRVFKLKLNVTTGNKFTNLNLYLIYQNELTKLFKILLFSLRSFYFAAPSKIYKFYSHQFKPDVISWSAYSFM